MHSTNISQMAFIVSLILIFADVQSDSFKYTQKQKVFFCLFDVFFIDGFISEMKYRETQRDFAWKFIIFSALFLALFACFITVITFPWLYSYVKKVQSHLSTEIRMCKSLTNGLNDKFLKRSAEPFNWTKSHWSKNRFVWKFASDILKDFSDNINATCEDCCIPGNTGSPGIPGKAGKPGKPGIPGPPGRPGFPPPSCFEVSISPCKPCPAGPPGPVGYAGPPGDPGPVGLSGIPGKDSEIFGHPGSVGPPGPPGNEGAEGPPGDPGHPAIPNFARIPGDPGVPGSDGPQGLKGPPGIPGSDGFPGIPGAIGIPGIPGPNGPPGQPGENGLPGPNGSPGNIGSCPKYCAVDGGIFLDESFHLGSSKSVQLEIKQDSVDLQYSPQPLISGSKNNIISVWHTAFLASVLIIFIA